GSREAVVADHLDAILAGFGLPGASLDAALTRFYATYGELALNPTSSSARQQVITEAQSLGSAFGDLSAQLKNARSAADQDLRDSLQEINPLAAELAHLNTAIAGAAPGALESLRDRQAVLLSSLTALADIDVIQGD